MQKEPSTIGTQQSTLDELLPAETASVEETMALGERLADHFQPGDIVALYGDLGAGKTHLVKGIARALGVDEAVVSSPTFTIVQEYAGTWPIYHIDAYRVEDLDEFYELGYEDEGRAFFSWLLHATRLTAPSLSVLYDVHGNVFEWTLSPWTDDYSERKDGVAEDPSSISVDEKVGDENIDDWANILFDQAWLSEGGQLEDPAGFVQRMNALLAEQPTSASADTVDDAAESEESA